ncbi:MAG TPA: (5-formylfuran-3-yl)methyl phosphate synthase [Burkholderiales bacterium]|nr:(5-formylfuran-3-yl)methyl phosphate synthase [Burkholderiales bacterium]
MTMMLASVRSLDEALVALEGGADLIDLKEPSHGALGALDHAAVRVCVHAIGGRRPVSATSGDIPSMEPDAMTDAVARMAATGVDFVKIGFFSGPRAHECAAALAGLARDVRLVAVLFADEPYDLTLLDELAGSGFTGAMLDTARKTGKALPDWRDAAECEQFVSRCRKLGLLTGLAGSLRKKDVAPLLAIGPDYLGFRGALCRHGERSGILDRGALEEIRAAIPESLPRIQRKATQGIRTSFDSFLGSPQRRVSRPS